jgi:hypothetical protein
MQSGFQRAPSVSTSISTNALTRAVILAIGRREYRAAHAPQ